MVFNKTVSLSKNIAMLDLNNDRELIMRDSISKGDIPRYVYKYMSLDCAMLILENSSLKFPSPREFNDPFDCKANLIMDSSVYDIFIFLFRLYYPIYSIQELYIKAAEIHRNPTLKYFTCVSSLDSVIKKLGVCCFSKINNQILMWSHYADKHTGVCLKFDLCQDFEFFTPLVVVTYGTKFLNYNCITESYRIIEHVCKKSVDWEYEQEVRVVKTNGVGIHRFKKEALSEVIFGCCCLPKKRAEIQRIVQTGKYPNVTFKEAKIRDGEYALDIENV